MKIVNYNNLPKPKEVMNEVNSKGYLVCNDVIDSDVYFELQKY